MISSFLDTREVAEYLSINEKQVYSLIHNRGLPGTKITGKWLFPRHLVDRWIESGVADFPEEWSFAQRAQGLLLIAGSDDPLLVRLISLFRRRFTETIPLQSRAGSTEGILALKRGLCHAAAVHLHPSGDAHQDADYLADHFDQRAVAVSMAVRTQGLLLPKGNPLGIHTLEDTLAGGRRWAGREVGTGTRLRLERELDRLGTDRSGFADDSPTLGSHMEVGVSVMKGQADVGLAIQAVAEMLGLDFIPLFLERFDLVVYRDTFFQKEIQNFFGLLNTGEFTGIAAGLTGYDISGAGRILTETI
ncbi:MAG: helix-turn-helix transcriptional regulator [Deltaproteobacteria bacterium]|nr:helix-turn-helix transcriptional regulator [Deltaproteobacteria bacterium]